MRYHILSMVVHLWADREILLVQAFKIGRIHHLVLLIRTTRKEKGHPKGRP